MECYAYREVNRRETLAEHVLGIIECQMGLWEFVGFRRKISRIYKADDKVVGDMLILAAIIHDLGKTRKDLQDRCSEECTRFEQHYVSSALLALRLGYGVKKLGLGPDNLEDRLGKLLSSSELNYLDNGDLYLILVVLPVLLHHYAQITSESSIFDGLDSAGNYLEVHENCVKELSVIVEKARSELVESEVGRELLDGLLTTIARGRVELSIFNSGKLRNFSESYEYVPGRLIVEAATGILNLCDGRVAFNNRHRPRAKLRDST